MELILVRHAQPGKGYENLSRKGMQQAQRLQIALQNKKNLNEYLCFSSQMSRAIVTARIASPQIFCIDERLNELNNGKGILQALKAFKKGVIPKDFENLLKETDVDNETFLNEFLSLNVAGIILFTHQFRALSFLMKLKNLPCTANAFWEIYGKNRLDFASFVSIKV